jgi:uncharacterized protein YoxC
VTIFSEQFLKKLIGNTDLEDVLQKLDKLTQDEARMAAAVLLKITHGVDSKVEGIDNRMKGVNERVQVVGSNVQDVGNRIQGVDDKVQEVGDRVQDLDDKIDQVNCSSSPNTSTLASENPDLTGNQLRDSLRQWLSPADPSTNYNIAADAHHVGTSQWFFQGSIFKDWQSAGSFLWIHGNRTYLLAFCNPLLLIALRCCSGLGKDHSLVCPSSSSSPSAY